VEKKENRNAFFAVYYIKKEKSTELVTGCPKIWSRKHVLISKKEN